jgi:(R,R)-butanediol dehydrogenase/meso-butanediol dehydrogenase/diacetyl reductase
VRALVFRTVRGLEIEDVPEPSVGPNELLLRPHYAQICLTDVLNQERWPPRWPAVTDDGRPRQHGGRWAAAWADGTVPGHEGGGDVVAVGSDVRGFAVGDRVLVDATYRCGRCAECLSLLFRDCSTFGLRSSTGRRIGPVYLGVNAPEPEKWGRGLMAEYCAVPAEMSYRCPDGVSSLGLVGGEIGGATLASVRCSGLQLGDNVVQIGGQLFGGYRMQLARLAGADRIVYVEADAVRRTWAREHGLADAVFDAADPGALDDAREVLGGSADVVFASATQPGSWALAARLVRRAGTIVPFDSDPRLPDVHLDGFDSAMLAAEGVRWSGHWPPIGAAELLKGGKGRNDHQIFVDLMAQGRIDGGLPVTRIVSLWDDLDTILGAFRDAWRTEVRTAVRIWGD